MHLIGPQGEFDGFFGLVYEDHVLRRPADAISAAIRLRFRHREDDPVDGDVAALFGVEKILYLDRLQRWVWDIETFDSFYASDL